MFKLPYSCSHFTIWQGSAQNLSSSTSTVCELRNVQAGFRKCRGIRDPIANICWIIVKAREFRKTSISSLLTMPKHSVDHNKLRKILQEMGIPDHLTCLMRNLYAGQEATVRTRHGTMDWFTIGKGLCQGWILSPCLFNFYAEYIMQNAGVDKAQAGIRLLGEISITSVMQMAPSL